MTNKEAKEMLAALSYNVFRANGKSQIFSDLMEALYKAGEALEKQIPKYITEDNCCPTCGASAIKEYESKYDYIYYNYCDNCGQILGYDI